MKVGVNEAVELKALAGELGIPFANLLRGYVLEDLLLRFAESDYREYLWLKDDRMLGGEAYRRGDEAALRFFYRERSRFLVPGKQVPGQVLTAALAAQMLAEVLQPENEREVRWEGTASGEPGAVTLALDAYYRDMCVPVSVEFRTLTDENRRPEARTLRGVAIPGKEISYLTYSAEIMVSQDLFEILEKLELIGDMGAYYRVYQALKSQPLSGRLVLDELCALAEGVPQVKKEKRVEQLAGYRSYSYMRKRWQQYGKRHGAVARWEEALDLILALAEPVWVSLCRGEVFLYDWMPELGRLL